MNTTQEEIIDAMEQDVRTYRIVAAEDVTFLVRIIRRQQKQIKSLKKKVGKL